MFRNVPESQCFIKICVVAFTDNQSSSNLRNPKSGVLFDASPFRCINRATLALGTFGRSRKQGSSTGRAKSAILIYLYLNLAPYFERERERESTDIMWTKAATLPVRAGLRGARNLSQNAAAMQSWAFPDKVRIVEVGEVKFLFLFLFLFLSPSSRVWLAEGDEFAFCPL